MKHFLQKSFLTVTAVSLLTIPQVSMAATNEIQVFSNGTLHLFQSTPYFQNDRMMVPLQELVELLGADVLTPPNVPDLLFVHTQDVSVQLFVGAKFAVLQDREVKLDVAPERVNGVVMVPVRFLAETFGATVTWDQNSNTLHIDRKKASDQVLNLPLTDDVMTLDPALATDANSLNVLSQIDEGLIRLDAGGRPTPGTSHAWEISADGKTYTFHLSKDAKWADGSPLTAQDYAYSWKRVLNPKTNSSYAFLLYPINGALDYNYGRSRGGDLGIKALDDHTLQFQLKNPVPYFLNLLANPVFFPVKQAVVEKQDGKYGKEADAILTDGPFKLTNWTHEQTLVLEKDPTYWDSGSVRLDQVNYQVIKDMNAVVNLYETGQLDRTTFLTGDFVSTYAKSPEFSAVMQPQTGYLEFNNRVKVLHNAKVRKALAYVIDTDQLAGVMYQNNGTVGATSFVPPGISDGHGQDFRHADLIDRATNAATAKELLQQGLKEEGVDTFSKLKLLADDSSTYKLGAQFIVDQWREKLGIDVEVDSVPFSVRLDRAQKQDFDIVMSAWQADYNDPTTFLDLMTQYNNFNNGYFYDADYESLLQKAHQETSNDNRMALLHKAEDRLITQDMAVAPLFFKGQSFLRKPYVKGWVDHPFGAAYDLKGTYIEGK